MTNQLFQQEQRNKEFMDVCLERLYPEEYFLIECMHVEQAIETLLTTVSKERYNFITEGTSFRTQ